MTHPVDISGVGPFAGLLLREIHADRFVYYAVSAYCALTILLLAATGNTHLFSYQHYFPEWPLIFGALMPAILLASEYWLLTLHRVRWLASAPPDHSARRIARLVAGIVLMQAMVLFVGSFTSIKNAMPVLRGGFPHDVVQADIDKWLAFGHDLPPLLASCCSSQSVLRLLELNYSQYWFLVVFGALFFVLVSPQADRIRLRFVVVFMLTWVACGNLVAFVFLSAGPIFFGDLTGDTGRFAVPPAADFGVVTAHYRDYLWQAYLLGKANLGTGISAFPSVHVAATFMLTLFAFEHKRWLGWIAALYAAVILFSSVLLGWHYAIDGYAAIAIVALIHFAVRKFAAGASGSLLCRRAPLPR